MIVKGFFRYRVYSFLIFLILVGPAFADFEGPPVVVVTPDAFPTNVSFFFPAGSPLERFTNQRDAWYAIYQTSLYPGYPYSIILRHNGDPSRVKLFALDKHPFDRVSMKMELRMKIAEMPSYIHGKAAPAYDTLVSIPENSKVPGIFLLVEWSPQINNDKPLPVSIQILSTGSSQLMGRGRTWKGFWNWNTRSPLQDRRPVELPVQR